MRGEELEKEKIGKTSHYVAQGLSTGGILGFGVAQGRSNGGSQ